MRVLNQTSTANGDEDDTNDPLREERRVRTMRNDRQMAILNIRDLKCLQPKDMDSATS